MTETENTYKLNPDLFINRELSWLKFEERILAEAASESNRLLERLKFLSITATNLDEFFMVRVASLMDLVRVGVTKTDISGLSPAAQLEKISKKAHELVHNQYRLLFDKLVSELAKQNVFISCADSGEYVNTEKIERLFDERIFPVLTPVRIGKQTPFPLVRNRFLNIGLTIRPRGKDREEYAIVEVPSGIKRVYHFKTDKGHVYVLLEDIIKANLHKLFAGYDILSVCTFRVMRNADLDIYGDETSDLITLIEEKVKQRQWGEAIRLEVTEGADSRFVGRLKAECNVSYSEVYEVEKVVDLSFLMDIYSRAELHALKREPYEPAKQDIFVGKDIFEEIKARDICLCHPFESFIPVVDFINACAKDRDVLAIKQTLYRVGGDSPIVKALSEAAMAGKQVTVLVELKARFDEEYNIAWARMLEQSGCHVIYSPAGMKTHCKIFLAVRREGDRIRRYVHLGTGNYNESTARQYTDISLFTADEAVGEDATKLFNMLSGNSAVENWNVFSVAPCGLRERFVELIEREIENKRQGKTAGICGKMNSLCDPVIIDALYRASNAGVRIELIVRGICCLRPGVKGVSENITVRSIVGNFLEHSRIYCFENGGNPELYCASADWMERNMDRRFELLFPINDTKVCEKLNYILTNMLKDNVRATKLTDSGEYIRANVKSGEKYSFQHAMCEEAKDL